jgi:serine/threonine-protein kinase
MTTPTHQLTDRAALLDALRASGLLTSGQLAKAAAVLPPEAATAGQAARFLVAAGFLTGFQADRLLAGRTDGFVLGQYVVQEQIGRGAMGRVFKARHRAMNRPVAIKVLNPELTRTAAARQAFGREVKAAAKLNHPNIVTAYDANEVGDRSYLVLEFVDGPTLEALVRENGPLPVGHACEFVRQAAWGLQHAHELGMVHRDVKPANLLVSGIKGKGSGVIAQPAASPAPDPLALTPYAVKITDFGIAKLGSEPDAGRGFVGTPDYVAPEQARDPDLADHRSDLYGLGCTFYFLLAGHPPFPSLSRTETIRRHACEEPARVERLRPDVPAAVAGIVHTLLAKDPAARFQSAAEVAARLEGLAAGGGAVSFDLPPSHPVPGSFTGGYLTGLNHTPTSDTSPWAQLTDEAGPPAAPTLDGNHERTPVVPRPTIRARFRRAGRGGGVSGLAVAGMCGAIFVGCILAIAAAIRVMGK